MKRWPNIFKPFRPTSAAASKARRLPATIWGFPVATQPLDEAKPETEGSQPQQQEKQETSRERLKTQGIALIIAIMIISVMMMLTTDMIINSQVNLQLAIAQRDNLKAEYMTKSAFNIGIMLLSADFAYDLFQAQQSPNGAKLTDSQGDFWSALNGMPIGGETVEMLGQFQEEFELSKVMDSSILDQLKLFDGSFTITVTDEQQKINISDCLKGLCTETEAMLTALFSCPAEKAFLEKKKVTPEALVARIKDWGDENSNVDAKSGYSDENEPYGRRNPPVSAKNAPFDSIDELRMIEGWDEEMQTVFAPYLTVFPIQKGSTPTPHKININSAPRALLTCLVPESRGDCAEKSANDFYNRDKDKSALAGASIADILKDSLCYSGNDSSKTDLRSPTNWFDQRSSTFRLEALGSVGDRERTLTAIIERVMPDVKKNEKASYKVLYWRLL